MEISLQTKTIITLAMLTLSTLTLHSATVTWDGGASDGGNWNSAANWSSDGVPSVTDDVVVNTGVNMPSSRRLSVNATATIQSLTSGHTNLVIRASGGSRTLTIGASDTSGASSITMNAKHTITTEYSFTSTGGGNLLYVEFGHQITLTNTNTSEISFTNARLQNSSTSTGTDTIFFAGSGNWAFLNTAATNSNNSSALRKNSTTATLDVELKSGGSDAFTGTLRYASTEAMNADNIRVNSGTLFLEDSVITTTGNTTGTGLIVGSGGSFAGAGIVSGSATIDGKLDVGTTASTRKFTFSDGLTLQTNARTYLDITNTAIFDSISLNDRQLIADGALLLTIDNIGNTANGDSWALFTDLAGVSGSFVSVSINGQTLTQNSGVWSSTFGQLVANFDQSTGILSFATVPIPEPSAFALLASIMLTFIVICVRLRKTT